MFLSGVVFAESNGLSRLLDEIYSLSGDFCGVSCWFEYNIFLMSLLASGEPCSDNLGDAGIEFGPIPEPNEGLLVALMRCS